MAISPINLGSFFTNSSGATVSSGISSGLNTDSIIKALTSATESEVTKMEDQVKLNDSKSSTLTSLKQILTKLQSAITPLSNPKNVDPTNNLFAVRSTEITSNTTQAATNYVGATISSGTASGTYTISDISQLATYTLQESNEFTLASATDSVVPATPAAGYFTAGTIVVRGQNITINEGDNLSEIAQAFNNVSDDTGIKASVLQTSPGKYKLVFTSTNTGVDARFDFADSGTLDSDPSGVLSNLTLASPTNGQDATFKFNGVTITRPSNNIDDLVPGITFSLKQNTVSQPGASIVIQVAPDIESITQGISNFASAYNNFLYFFSQQTERNGDGSFKDTALLNSDSTLRTIYNSLSAVAASIVKGLPSGALNSFSAIGISFTDYAGDSSVPATGNILNVDTSKLASLLATDFEGVQNVFGDGFTSSSSDLLLYKAATNAGNITSFTLDITHSPSPGTYVATYLDENNVQKTVNFTATPLNTGGVSLKADENSVFKGMTLIWGTNNDATGINVTVTQGLLSRFQNIVDNAVKAANGMIVNGQNAIAEENKTIQTRIDAANQQLSTTRDALLQKYALLEAAITQANSVLNLLNAQQLASQT